MKVHVKALTRATSATVFLIAAVTVYAELSEVFKNFLKSITGHHWITKSVFSLVFFALFYFILSKTTKDDSDVQKEVRGVIISVILSGLVILGFYIWHFLAA